MPFTFVLRRRPVRRFLHGHSKDPPMKTAAGPPTFTPPTLKVSRLKRNGVLTPAERAVVLASPPDLKGDQSTMRSEGTA